MSSPVTAIRYTGTVTRAAEFQTSVAPPLKWAGGKRWQIPHLRPLWLAHSHRRLVEPFAGGLAVTLGLMPEKALLNDTNEHLVNFYRWLQVGLKIEIPLKNSEKLFYRHRSRFNALVATEQADTDEAAALFYYLNRTGFNGLCRFNASGEFNVPFGKYKKILYRRGGTAEQKVPFEVMCLADAVTGGHGSRAFLVLGGDGWKLRDYFTSGKLAEHLIHADLVRVVTLEAFIRIANNGKL